MAVWAASPAGAQMTDTGQTPNRAGAGIHKSLTDQIGWGRGDWVTRDSSAYLIARDPFRSIRRGRQLFQRKFTAEQGLGPRMADGSGDIETTQIIGAGLADSCAACHGRPKGSAGVGGDVFTRPDSRDAPHLFGLGLVEMLADEITADLRAIRAAAIRDARLRRAPVSRALASKGIAYGAITARPDGTVNTAAVRGVDADLRVRPFFAQGKSFAMREFIVGALKAEMGLEAVDPDLAAAAAGKDVVTPAGMRLSGTTDQIDAPPAADTFADPDGDGVTHEVPEAAVDHLEFYLLNYFKPGLYRQTVATRAGREAFDRARCGTCHVPNLTIRTDRRVADVETVYDPAKAIFNGLFATAAARFTAVADGTGYPAVKKPSGQPFVVKNIFADFKRHDLGPAFHEKNFDGTVTTQFMTEPLWGVGSTSPYGHDGRSINLREVILRHGGEAKASRDAFAALPELGQEVLIQFLESLVLFPPDDTASNLDGGNSAAPNYPQNGHGSIALTVLFEDSSDLE
jgi:hypothetical protein